eukprot:CAMPEP_0184659028 /NCGR_PEP_ID=MMETSP0308-20130426/27828_1 /TAXON_ID=38269 /ORGANISM="Gloeochaete witrockiana, Strain SAG 46.84" /LENGTH=122 /DNA_ID=CAMNT_0027098485 /DNA_START=114 /DNA_END=483 /DNA_ORIENTATION=+
MSERIYVGKLNSRTKERDIDDIFSRYGNIRSIELKYGYAFVEYEDRRDADEAIRKLDGYDFDGSRIIVEKAHGGGRRSTFASRNPGEGDALFVAKRDTGQETAENIQRQEPDDVSIVASQDI